LILEGLRHQQGLKTLLIGRNGICSQGAYAVSDFLLQNNCLSELHIEQNLISSPGLNSLLQALAIKNRSLKYLDFADNFVSVEVMHSLKSMLESNQVLKYLVVTDLHHFQIDAQKLICLSFKSNKGLRQVDLG